MLLNKLAFNTSLSFYANRQLIACQRISTFESCFKSLIMLRFWLEKNPREAVFLLTRTAFAGFGNIFEETAEDIVWGAFCGIRSRIAGKSMICHSLLEYGLAQD
ncbi:MAG TPA: hypothetical protein VFZ08_15410 [Terriglobia bacterium]|nr:hypothetical protein [Terriglobia bacterium]